MRVAMFRLRSAMIGLVFCSAAAGASASPLLPPLPGGGAGFGFHDATIRSQYNSYAAKLDAEWKRCDRAGFNHDLANLAALAEIAQQHADQQHQQVLDENPKAALAAAEKQRADLNTPYGQAFADSAHLNVYVSWFKSFPWNHCAEAVRSMTVGPTGAGASTGPRAAWAAGAGQ